MWIFCFGNFLWMKYQHAWWPHRNFMFTVIMIVINYRNHLVYEILYAGGVWKLFVGQEIQTWLWCNMWRLCATNLLSAEHKVLSNKKKLTNLCRVLSSRTKVWNWLGFDCTTLYTWIENVNLWTKFHVIEVCTVQK